MWEAMLNSVSSHHLYLMPPASNISQQPLRLSTHFFSQIEKVQIPGQTEWYVPFSIHDQPKLIFILLGAGPNPEDLDFQNQVRAYWGVQTGFQKVPSQSSLMYISRSPTQLC